MKYYILFVFFIVGIVHAFPQLAVIDDKDNYVTIHDDYKKEIGRLSKGEIVFAFDSEGEWNYSDYTRGKDIKSGYLPASRLCQISKFSEIPVEKEVDDTITLRNDSIEITFTRAKFDSEKHRLATKPGYGVERIDGRLFFGEDGGIPKSQYGIVKIKRGQSLVNLPALDFTDLFNPNLSDTQAYHDKAKDILYITANNSDGAGGYTVVWVIEKNKYKKRYIYRGF